jgi:predicted transcriptional regulator
MRLQTGARGKYKENPKYNVVSMRISDEEMLTLEEMTRLSKKSKSRLMREAIMMYKPLLEM